MGKRFVSVIAVGIACFLFWAGTCRGDYNWQTRWVSERGRGMHNPSLYNGQIAWSRDPDYTCWYNDLYFWDGSDVRQLTDTPWINEGSPSLYDGKIAYNADPEGIWQNAYWDGVDYFQITSGEGKRGLPSLYDGKIAYSNKESETDWDIYYWDSVTGETIRVCDTELYNGYPVMYENTIAWIGGEHSYDNEDDIYYWDGENTIIIPSRCAYWKPSLYDGQIAWAEVFGYGDDTTSDIMLWNGEVKLKLTSNPGPDVQPSLFDGKIAYAAYDGHDTEIMYWDGKDFYQVTNDDFDNRHPSLYITDSGQIQLAYLRIHDWDVFEGEIVYLTSSITEPSVILIGLNGFLCMIFFLRKPAKKA